MYNALRHKLAQCGTGRTQKLLYKKGVGVTVQTSYHHALRYLKDWLLCSSCWIMYSVTHMKFSHLNFTAFDKLLLHQSE